MQAAWIAFAGVVFGAVIGFLGPVLTTRLTVQAQLSTAALNTFLTARLNAYKEYEEAMEDWAQEKGSEERIVSLYHAMNVVCMVASEETIHAMSVVQKSVRKYHKSGILPEEKEFDLQKAQLLVSMHCDLLTYPIPKVQTDKKTDT